MAQDLGVSTGLIYKIETIFGLRAWSSRLPGKKSEYSEAQKNFFLKAICLNSNFFANLPDIKALFELEKRLAKQAKLHFPVASKNPPTGIGRIAVFLIAGLYCPIEGIPYDSKKFESDKANAVQIRRLYEEYTALFKKIADETHRRQNMLKAQIARIDEIAMAKV
jgi:hypothetical protein